MSSAASPTSTAMLRSAVTLEQRKAPAARIGDRVCGPWGYTHEGALTVARAEVPVVSYQAIARAKRAKLRRAGTSPPRSAGYSVERARYRRAMAGSRAHGSDASVEGVEDKPRYTDAQVEALGKEGKAFKKRDGSYSYPVADRRDLLNAIKAFGRARPSEASALKAWLKMRARVMQLESLLPASWQSKAGLKTASGGSESPYTGTTESVGGQSQ